jgi:hypothetical protein
MPQGAHALWSIDGGASWVAGSPTLPNVNENQLAPLSNGSLLMNARTDSKDRLSLLSTDEGKSWSAPRVVPELSGNATCEGSLFSHGGKLFFSHPQAPTRERLTIRASRDDGDSWAAAGGAGELLVHAGGSAYSSLGSTSKGELAVLWEADGTDLAFAATSHFTSITTSGYERSGSAASTRSTRAAKDGEVGTATAPAAAPLPFRVPSILASNMLLQRGRPAKIWGWAPAGSHVTVALDSAAAAGGSLAAADGTFVVVLPAQPAALNRTLSIRAAGAEGGVVTLANVAFGDLYFCSGQVGADPTRLHRTAAMHAALAEPG